MGIEYSLASNFGLRNLYIYHFMNGTVCSGTLLKTDAQYVTRATIYDNSNGIETRHMSYLSPHFDLRFCATYFEYITRYLMTSFFLFASMFGKCQSEGSHNAPSFFI